MQSVNSLFEKVVVKSKTIIQGILHFHGEGEHSSKDTMRRTVQFEWIRLLTGCEYPSKTLTFDPQCLQGLLRFRSHGPSSQEVVIFFMPRDGSAGCEESAGIESIEEGDLILPVVRDPLNDEKYIKIPPEYSQPISVHDKIARLWKTTPLEKQDQQGRNEPHFQLFDDFYSTVLDLSRDLKKSVMPG